MAISLCCVPSTPAQGFESINYLHTERGQPYLLGLCEGNHCQGGAEGRDPGHGRIVASTLAWKE